MQQSGGLLLAAGLDGGNTGTGVHFQKRLRKIALAISEKVYYTVLAPAGVMEW